MEETGDERVCVCAAPEPEDELEVEVARAYEDFAAGLYRYAVVIVRQREGAQDAVQEAYLRYFIARSQGQKILNAKAWLYRVLHNHMLDSLKSHAVKKETGIEAARQTADRAQDPEVSYRHRELARRMSSLLAPRELQCLRLRNEGFDYEEIATILEVRSGTVGALLARGQKKIRKALEQPAPALAARWAENPC